MGENRSKSLKISNENQASFNQDESTKLDSEIYNIRFIMINNLIKNNDHLALRNFDKDLIDENRKLIYLLIDTPIKLDIKDEKKIDEKEADKGNFSLGFKIIN